LRNAAGARLTVIAREPRVQFVTLTCIDDYAGRPNALTDDRLRLSPTSHDQGRARSFEWIEELLAPIPVTV
jgi:hypothetical protein